MNLSIAQRKQDASPNAKHANGLVDGPLRERIGFGSTSCEQNLMRVHSVRDYVQHVAANIASNNGVTSKLDQPSLFGGLCRCAWREG